MIFSIIWSILLPQHSILQDVFQIRFNGKMPRGSTTYSSHCRSMVGIVWWLLRNVSMFTKNVGTLFHEKLPLSGVLDLGILNTNRLCLMKFLLPKVLNSPWHLDELFWHKHTNYKIVFFKRCKKRLSYFLLQLLFDKEFTICISNLKF